MVAAFDAVGPAGGAGTAFASTSESWAHINNGNAILVGVTVFTGSTDTITAVSYGGVALTKIGFSNTGSTSGGISERVLSYIGVQMAGAIILTRMP